jgi:glycosyltransferase involved in cell wall biosynthesis
LIIPVPLVTIGLNAFNATDTIASAVASALAQNWAEREVLIVDDASTDGTAARIRELTAGRVDARLLVNEPNRGLAASRNRIIEEARGEFIVFFDDDDVSVHERVAIQVQRILAYERDFAQGAPVLCHSARLQDYPDGRRRLEHTMGENAGAAPSGEAVARRVLMGSPLENGYGSCAGCSQAARTTTFRALGGFDTAFRRAEDTDFCVRAARAGTHFVGVGMPLVTQTMTGGSDKTLDLERKYALQLIDKHRDFFASPTQCDFTRSWTEMKFDWMNGNRLGFVRRLLAVTARHPLWTSQRLSTALPRADGNRALRELHHSLGRP